MNEWQMKVSDYWDINKDAINVNSLKINEMQDDESEIVYGQIREAVRTYTEHISDKLLLMAATSMVDDIYKTINDRIHVTPDLYKYIQAFGQTLLVVLSNRGYTLRYIVDNTFKPENLFMGPFDIFEQVFQSAGLIYICPQQIGFRLMLHDNLSIEDYFPQIQRYIAEARYVGDQIVEKCQKENRHYIFLETDYEEGALALALKGVEEAGVLRIIRNEAPIPGSKIGTSFPEGILDEDDISRLQEN